MPIPPNETSNSTDHESSQGTGQKNALGPKSLDSLLELSKLFKPTENVVELIKKEKLRLISEIMSVYTLAVLEKTGLKYPYGDAFDKLYDKDVAGLKLTLSVSQAIRKKETTTTTQ